MKQLEIPINKSVIRNQLLNFTAQFDTYFFYDSNSEVNIPDELSYGSYDFLVGLGVNRFLDFKNDNAFSTIEDFQKLHKTWLFGYLSYDLKNQIEQLSSDNKDALNLPLAQFIEPQLVIAVQQNKMTVITLAHGIEIENIIIKIQEQSHQIDTHFPSSHIVEQTSESSYIKAFEQFQQQIAYGNIYEVNYCIAFNTEIHHHNYMGLYALLNEVSKAPFSALVKVNNLVVVSASPERFLKKQGLQLISQPIKGTAKRGLSVEEDQRNKNELQCNEKERTENVMITDLVRNDLSKYAARNSVKVQELFGIYSFKQVHQMISTVVATLNDPDNYLKALKEAFPMGSMTGAPKIMAMKLIEQHEEMKRGLYSGALGYIDPNNNFDFNVLIRSIVINTTTNQAQFCVGSAITAKANAKDEYQECLLKANALFKVLA
ncbi:MAG TPA: anthranilate synthase component I family protein [Bacteroidia bacterium]|nr:anthranilate synthase component I family protein [Bacteroidia bacterium]